MMTIFFEAIKQLKRDEESRIQASHSPFGALTLPGEIWTLLQKINFEDENDNQQYDFLHAFLKQQNSYYFRALNGLRITHLHAFKEKMTALILDPDTLNLPLSEEEVLIFVTYYLMKAKLWNFYTRHAISEASSLVLELKSISLLYHQQLLTIESFSFIAQFIYIEHTAKDVLNLLQILKRRECLHLKILQLIQHEYKFNLGAVLLKLDTLEYLPSATVSPPGLTRVGDATLNHFNEKELTAIIRLDKKTLQNYYKKLCSVEESLKKNSASPSETNKKKSVVKTIQFDTTRNSRFFSMSPEKQHPPIENANPLHLALQ